MAIDMKTRNDRIKAALKDGKSIADVATKFELSTARIWKIANNFKEAPRTNGKPKARAKTAAKRVNGKAKAKALGISKAHQARKAAVKKKDMAKANGNGNGKTSLSAAAATVQG